MGLQLHILFPFPSHPHVSKIGLNYSHHKSSRVNVSIPNCGALPFLPHPQSHYTRHLLIQLPFVPTSDGPQGSLVPFLQQLLDLKYQSGPISENIRYGPLQRELLSSKRNMHNSEQIKGTSVSIVLHACFDSNKLKSMVCVLIWRWLYKCAQGATMQ